MIERLSLSGLHKWLSFLDIHQSIDFNSTVFNRLNCIFVVPIEYSYLSSLLAENSLLLALGIVSVIRF